MADEKLSAVLSDFARTMLTDFPIQGILDRLVKLIVEILPVTAAGVTLITPDLKPRYVAASNPSALAYEQLQTELGEGPCLAAYLTGDPVAIPNLMTDDRFKAFAPRAIQAGLQAAFTFPLNHEHKRLGALDLYRDVAGSLSAEAMSTAQTLADVAAAYVINAQARADLQDSTNRSREAALHDALTGLPNRALLVERVEHAFSRSLRSGRISAVFFLDLDHFKTVNDTYGHQIGDGLLIDLAARLSSVLRPGDTLARLSGDEFVILCEDLEEHAETDSIATRIDEALTTPFVIAGVELQVEVSIGVAVTGRGSDTPEELIHEADISMYRAKRDRNQDREVLDPGKPHFAQQSDSLACTLPTALERGELDVVYQPIINTSNGRLAGVEALLRWEHPTRGSVPPAVFVPFAEQSGQILQLGRWVLERACRELREWAEEGLGQRFISVNVSAHQIMAPDFVDGIEAILSATGIAPDVVTLEVTETVFVHDHERAVVVLNQLKGIGVRLALDDFGTGYSSLSYLDSLPTDTIKIDQRFIASLGVRPKPNPVVASIICLAHDLGMTVVAEGVENAEQYDTLAELGADACQGFYFATPMPAAAVRRFTEGQALNGPRTRPR